MRENLKRHQELNEYKVELAANKASIEQIDHILPLHRLANNVYPYFAYISFFYRLSFAASALSLGQYARPV